MARDDDPIESVARGIVVAGRYRVVSRLGVGGMGEVYLVQHVHTDERLAMKVLLSTTISDEIALERFRREARTPARIDSDHIVRVTDADVATELNGAPFLIMEYLRGEDLEAYLEKTGPMTPTEVVGFLGQLARALDKAHAIGIVHRDLKPENIFITRREDGTAHLKILDFGIAKFTSGATQDFVNKTATSPGAIFGTPLYMSPEQAKGESNKISPQTDQWAIGIIAHRMLTHSDFWDAQTLTALISQVVYEPMKKPSERGFNLGPGYDDWFLKTCSREPELRWKTVSEAVFRLGQALGVIEDAPYSGPAPSFPKLPSVKKPVEASTMLSTADTRPLSKTDLQLASSDDSKAPPAQKSGGIGGKVAAAVILVGAAIGAVFFVANGRGAGDANGSRQNGDVTAGALTTQPPTDPIAVVTPASTATSGAAVQPSADPTTNPTVEPTASAKASSSVKTTRTSTVPTGSGKTSPPASATSQTPAPSASQKKTNPLETRL